MITSTPRKRSRSQRAAGSPPDAGTELSDFTPSNAKIQKKSPLPSPAESARAKSVGSGVLAAVAAIFSPDAGWRSQKKSVQKQTGTRHMPPLTPMPSVRMEPGGPIERLHGCEHWLWLSGVDKLRAAKPLLYSQLCNAPPPPSEVVDQIDLDVGRTSTREEDDDDDDQRSPCCDVEADERREALRRVLCAFALHDPGTSYVQGMGDIAARALFSSDQLTAASEEAAFWWLVHVNDVLLKGFFSRGMAAVLLEMRTLSLGLHALSPRLATHLGSLDCDLTYLAPSWYLTLFQRILATSECGPAISGLAVRKLEPTHVALGILLASEERLLAANSFEHVARVLCGAMGSASRRVPPGALRAAVDAAAQLPGERLKRLRESGPAAPARVHRARRK